MKKGGADRASHRLRDTTNPGIGTIGEQSPWP